MIDCLGIEGRVASTGKPIRNGNTSGCAGHEAGLQLGNAGTWSWQCAPRAWCDDQAYFYEVSFSQIEK